MARFTEPTTEQQTGWAEWVASRPANVRAVAERFDPWSLYRLRDTGQRVTLASFSEGSDGSVTLTVSVSGEFNLTMFDRAVFGISPDDLEPCDVPNLAEATGSILSPDEVEDHIDELRVAVRPDLWVLDPDGKAQRKQ